MAFTYDVATDRGRVRLLITDTDTSHAIFTDAEVDAFLGLESSSVKRAAASALDQIASNEALVQKRIRLLDLSTDGPSVAKALREHAALLRTQADAGEAAEDGGSFDWAEMVVNDFSARERLWNQALRS